MGTEESRTRRRALQAVGSVVLAGLAGCGSAGPGSDGGATTRTTAPTGTATTRTAQTTATESDPETAEPTGSETTDETTTEHDHEHATTASPDDVEFAQNPEAVHASLVEAATVPDDEVLIGFRLEDSSLPFTTEVYHAPTDAEIQATETYETQDLAEVGLVPDPPWALSTAATDREDVHYASTPVGEPLAVTLVARHDGASFEWSAWDRTGYPYDGHAETDPALTVDCYCGGETYTAPAGGTWARVIQVTPTDRVDPGTAVALNWTSSRL